MVAVGALTLACGNSDDSNASGGAGGAKSAGGSSMGGDNGSGGTSSGGIGGAGVDGGAAGSAANGPGGAGGSAGGSTGGAAGGGTGGAAGSATDAAVGGTGGTGGTASQNYPRLAVANSDARGTLILDNVDQLGAGADPTADVALGGTSVSVGVVVLVDALAVATTDTAVPVSLFRGLGGLSDGMARSAGVPVAEIAGFSKISTPRMFGGADGTLWLSRDDNDVLHSYPNAERLGDATVAGPNLTHPFKQLVSFAITNGNERAFAGQISGGGLVGWTAPLPGTSSRDPDFVLSADCTSWAMTLHSNDLFVTCQGRAGGDASLRIWHDASKLSSTVGPDIALSLPSTDAWGIDVYGDTLAISTSSNGILIYTGIASLSAASTPTNTLDAGVYPRKVRFDSSGRLYTFASDPTGIQVFANVTTATTRHTLLTGIATAPVDFTLIQ